MAQDKIEFEQVIEKGCGIDIHKSVLVVTVQGKGIKTETRSFDAFTESIIELRDWLKILYYSCSHGKYRSVLETCLQYS